MLFDVSEKITRVLDDRAKMFPPSFFFSRIAPKQHREQETETQAPYSLRAGDVCNLEPQYMEMRNRWRNGKVLRR